MSAVVMVGDCRELMDVLADESVDAIVTDPPYELGFMGKSWDASGIAYDLDVWRQALRVLKPGGHLLAFSGSRTYHRMVCAIEDAGFEIRDQIMWLYGSGFPKSHDVSKAIDKLDASEAQQARRYRFTEWVRSTGMTAKQIDDATSTNMGGHYTTAASQPAIMTLEHLDAVRHLIGEVPEWVERECEIRSVESENFKRREVVGQKTAGIRANHDDRDRHTIGGSAAVVVDITAPATPEAERWSGWGTALKPAHEPIVVARKPFKGTVAQNVLAHGTGALNIDGCRVGTEDNLKRTFHQDSGVFGSEYQRSQGYRPNWHRETNNKMQSQGHDAGRWPANVIHDGSDEVTSGIGESARFFYCAKASKRDREEGLDGFEVIRTGGMQATADGSMLTGSGNERTTARANHHPTVKPTDLMRYLCRLVTPPGGIVLDPFTGSGSTGKAAVLEGFRFLGCELSEEYAAIARARIAAAQGPGAQSQGPDTP